MTPLLSNKDRRDFAEWLRVNKRQTPKTIICQGCFRNFESETIQLLCPLCVRTQKDLKAEAEAVRVKVIASKETELFRRKSKLDAAQIESLTNHLASKNHTIKELKDKYESRG